MDYEEALLQVTDVLKAHNRYHMNAPDHEQAVKAIREIVTPNGKWINRCCTECGTFTSLNIFNVKYCPECGARMESDV